MYKVSKNTKIITIFLQKVGLLLLKFTMLLLLILFGVVILNEVSTVYVACNNGPFSLSFQNGLVMPELSCDWWLMLQDPARWTAAVPILYNLEYSILTTYTLAGIQNFCLKIRILFCLFLPLVFHECSPFGTVFIMR